MTKPYPDLLADLAQTYPKAPLGEPVTRIVDPKELQNLLQVAGPHLLQENATRDLSTIYEASFHHPTGSLIIANKGAVLYCLSPLTKTPHLVHHQGIAVYRPEYGVEMVNVGLVGDVYAKPVVMRAESACSPSFLYGSQRCNCRHQWEVSQELAARFNELPDHSEQLSLKDGVAFERWVQSRMTRFNGRVEFLDEGSQGFILLHLDSQNGMGSGTTLGEFVPDLYVRASMRHRGEYTAEQVHNESMAGAFNAIGIQPDPRSLNEGVGYQTAFIVLDHLGVNPNIHLLSNNHLKWTHPASSRYSVTPIPLVGEVNVMGLEEAESRNEQFGHTGIGSITSMDDELTRLREHIKDLGLR